MKLHLKTSRQGSRSGLPLWLEIILIIVLKVMALFLLWKLFFSHPDTKKMRLPTGQVEQHLLMPVLEGSQRGSNASDTHLPIKSNKNQKISNQIFKIKAANESH